MNKTIREMSHDKLKSLTPLGLDDTFEFQCKSCGKCCKHRSDILLTAYDLFRIAVYFNRTPQEIYKRYCEVYEGGNSHFPVVRVLPVPPDNNCPFLRNKKCSIHIKKPVVCRVYPLARMFWGEGSEIRYVFSGANCKHEPRSITVREWIADVASEESETAGKLWGEVITTIVPVIQPDKLISSQEEREKILTIIFNSLWLSYDIREPFTPQLEENLKQIKSILNKL